MFSPATKTAARVTEASAENDLKSTLRDRADKATRTVKDAYDHAVDYAEDAGQKLRSLADNSSENLRTAADHASGRIRANPLPSALIALGAGFVLGLLLRGSPRRY